MKIRGLILLEEIVEKLARKHNVSQEEVKQVFLNSHLFRFVEKGHRSDENVYSALGQTHEGRHLIVFFVYKGKQQALILSAREMTGSERDRYEKE